MGRVPTGSGTPCQCRVRRSPASRRRIGIGCNRSGRTLLWGNVPPFCLRARRSREGVESENRAAYCDAPRSGEADQHELAIRLESNGGREVGVFKRWVERAARRMVAARQADRQRRDNGRIGKRITGWQDRQSRSGDRAKCKVGLSGGNGLSDSTQWTTTLT